MELLSDLGLGLALFSDGVNVAACVLGVLFGLIAGSLTGISIVATVALVLPLTFGFPPTASIIAMVSIPFGAICGRTGAAVLAQGGSNAEAEFRGIAIRSAAAAALAVVAVIVLAPLLADAVQQFGPIEYALLEALVLIAAGVFASGGVLRSLALIVVGLSLGLVGSDIETGSARMTFGLPQLEDGFSLPSVALGLFVVADLISALAGGTAQVSGADDARPSGFVGAMVFGLLSGWFAGNGGGLTTVAGEAGASEAPDALDPAGHATAGQTSDAAAAGAARLGASVLPIAALGIPTNPVAALVLGTLLVQGLVPGPGLPAAHPEALWGLFAGALIAQVALVGIVVVAAGALLPLSRIDFRSLAPIVLAYCCVAAYAVNADPFEVFVMLGFGASGHLLTRWRCERGLVVIAFVMSALFEENLRRAVLITRGDLSEAFQRPMVDAMLAIAAVILIVGRLARRKPAVVA